MGKKDNSRNKNQQNPLDKVSPKETKGSTAVDKRRVERPPANDDLPLLTELPASPATVPPSPKFESIHQQLESFVPRADVRYNNTHHRTPSLPEDLMSHSPSRTATPATAAYQTADCETPTRQQTPVSAGLPPVPAAVRRSITIDWPLDLATGANGDLIPFNHSFPAPGISSIICTNDIDAHGNHGVNILLEVGYAASVDLQIFNQVDSSGQVISRFRDSSFTHHFHISWKAIRAICFNASSTPVLVSITITATPDAPPQTNPFYYPTPSISETSSPAAIEALAHFLDQPGGHDVVFCFPDHKHLYADRYVLQRASRHFYTLFNQKKPDFAQLRSPGQKLGDDSDAEPSNSDNEEGSSKGSSKGSSLRARSSPSQSERDITTLHSAVQTPLTSVNGDIDPMRAPLPGEKFTLQPTGAPLMDDNVFVMDIKETSFNTFRALLYYLYTGFISFSPLTSSFSIPEEDIAGQPAAVLEHRRLDARNYLIQDYMRRYPNRPVPVSPKSIYAVAKKYDLAALEAQALSRINSAIVNPLVSTAELFSAFTRAHESIRESQIGQVIDYWEDVVRSRDWELASQKGKAQPDAYFATALCEILERLPVRAPRTPIAAV